MAITSRVTLKAAFEQGDKPQGSDYADWIDSFVHLTDTSAQAISSPVSFTGSATFVNINCADIDTSAINFSVIEGAHINVSALSANTTHTDTLKVSGVTSAANIFADNLTLASGLSATQVFADRLEAASAVIVSGLARFLTASALTVHVIDYSVHTTVKASAGNASAVPATAAGYIPIVISGVSYRLVLYNP